MRGYRGIGVEQQGRSLARCHVRPRTSRSSKHVRPHRLNFLNARWMPKGRFPVWFLALRRVSQGVLNTRQVSQRGMAAGRLNSKSHGSGTWSGTMSVSTQGLLFYYVLSLFYILFYIAVVSEARWHWHPKKSFTDRGPYKPPILRDCATN